MNITPNTRTPGMVDGAFSSHRPSAAAASSLITAAEGMAIDPIAATTLPSRTAALSLHAPVVQDLDGGRLPELSNTREELVELVSGFKTSTCDLKELNERFTQLYNKHKEDFSILSNLIDLCCPFYAAKLCRAEQYNQIRALHTKLAAALNIHRHHDEYQNRTLFIAEQMIQWGDRLLALHLPSEVQQFYLCAFEIIDQLTPLRPSSRPNFHSLQLQLLEKLGDIHALLQNYLEAMKFHFSILSYISKQKPVKPFPTDQLHEKMIKNYHNFLNQLGVTDYATHYIETLNPTPATIKAIGNELLILKKFKQAAAVYRMGGSTLKAEAKQAALLADGRVAFNRSCFVLPWQEQQLTLQSIRKEIQTLQGVHAQNTTTGKYIALLQELVKKSMAILGAPPTIEVNMGIFNETQTIPYAFIGLGSMSHSGMSLYSDLEFAILVKEATPEVLDYFAKLTQLIEMQTIFFAETSPMPDDERFQRGFAFDDKGNTPLGAGQHRQVNLQQMRGHNELNIKTPIDMAMIIPPKSYGIENLILSHALCSANLAFGDEQLFQTFLAERESCLSSEARHDCTDAFITETLFFAPSLYQEGRLNVKKHLYRMLSLLILELSHYHKIDFELLRESPRKQLTLIDRLTRLQEQNIIDETIVQHIVTGLNLAVTMRNQAQIFYGNEQEDVYEQPDVHRFALTDQTELIEVYHTILLPIKNYIERLATALSQHDPLPTLHATDPMMVQAYAEGHFACGEYTFLRGQPELAHYMAAQKLDCDQFLKRKIEQQIVLIQCFQGCFDKCDATVLETLLLQTFAQFGRKLLTLPPAEAQTKYNEAVKCLCSGFSEKQHFNLFLQALVPLEKKAPDLFAELSSERGFQHAIRVDGRRFLQKLGIITQSRSPFQLNTWRNGKMSLDTKFDTVLDKGRLKKFNTHGRRSSHPFGALYFKESPELPGIEWAVYSLKKLLFGIGAAYADFGFLTLPDQSMLYVQISETIEGTNFLDLLKDSPSCVSKINPTNYSKLLLDTLLISPEDDRPDNFIATPSDRGWMLTCIDNDHAFSHQAVYKGRLGTLAPLVKSILFCLPQMQDVIDPEACKIFCRLDVAYLLQQWMNELKNYNEKIFSLICTDAVEGAALYSTLFNEKEIYIPVFLKQGLMSRLYNRMVCLQTVLKKGPCTHLELLRYVEPELAAFFTKLSKKSPLDLYFKEVYQQEYSVRGSAYCTQSTTSNMAQYAMGKALPKHLRIQTCALEDAETILQEVQELQARNQTQLAHSIEFELASPNESLNSAQRELAWRGRGIGELQNVQKALKEGVTTTFQALSEVPAFQEEVETIMASAPLGTHSSVSQKYTSVESNESRERVTRAESDQSQTDTLPTQVLPDLIARQEAGIASPQASPLPTTPSLSPITWSFDLELPSLAREAELQALISGLKVKRNLKDLKKQFDYMYRLYRDDFPVLSDLITLCCPHYAAQLCPSLDDYEPIRLLHEDLSKALEKHPSEKQRERRLFLAQELERWGDQFLAKGLQWPADHLQTKQLLLEARLFYLSAFKMIDQTTESTTLNSLSYLSLLEKMGDTHVAMKDHTEGMKYYFAVHNHQPSTLLHQKMISTYRGFLAYMGVTEYFLAQINIDEYSEAKLAKLIPSTDFVKSVGDELLIQKKFHEAAALYQLGNARLSKEASSASLLGDAESVGNRDLIQQEFQPRAVGYQLATAESDPHFKTSVFIDCPFPWIQFQEKLQSIRAELQSLKGLDSQRIMTDKVLALFQELIQRSIAILGSPEMPYAFLSLGSMSFSGMSLYSDLEFVILVEQNEPAMITYCTKLTQILEMLTIFLGETPPRDFPEDDRFQRGFGFDEKGNTPLGAGLQRQGRQGRQSLDLNIKTPAEMARMIPPREGFLENLILTHVLCGANFAFGDRELFTTFLKEREALLDPATRTHCTHAFIQEVLHFSPTLYVNGKLNVKKDLYRMLSLLILELSFYHKIEAFTLQDRLDKLKEQSVIDDFFSGEIKKGLDYAATLRNRAQAFYGNEREDVFDKVDEDHFTITEVSNRLLFEVYCTILLPIRKYIELLDLTETFPPLYTTDPFMKQALAEGHYAHGEELFNRGIPQAAPYQQAQKYNSNLALVEKIDQKLMLIRHFGPSFRPTKNSHTVLSEAFVRFSETMTQPQFFESVHLLSTTPYIDLFLKIISPTRLAAFWSERGFQHALWASSDRFSQKLLEITAHSSPYELNTYRHGKLALDHTLKDIIEYSKKNGYSIRRSNTYGRRNTHPFKQLYIKENPEMPGVEWAIYFLKTLLFGCGAPPSEFGTLTLPEGRQLYLQLSEKIEGENFADLLKREPQCVKALHPTCFSQLFLATLLINPEDDRPDNFIATRTPQGIFLTCIDNDHGFADQAVLPGSHTPLVKSILFCLPQMQEVIDPVAREMFCHLDVAHLLQQWLQELKKFNETIFQFENAAHYTQLLQTKEIYVPIFLKQGLMTRLYNRMISLQTLLKKDLKHIDLLHYIEPELATFFRVLPNKPPLELYFNEIYKKGYFAKKGHYKTQSTTTNMINYQMGRPAPKKPKIEMHDIKDPEAIKREIEQLRGREQTQVRSIDFEIESPNESLNAAQRELAWRGRGADELQKIQKDLKEGRTATFQALIEVPAFQEEIINTLDFREIDPAIQIKILDACVGMRMRTIKLRYLSVEINFISKLEEILRTSGMHLLHLDLSHSRWLRSTAMIAKHCPQLEELILDDISTLEVIEHVPRGRVAYVNSGEFNQLRNLSAKQCLNLQEVKLHTTSLETCNLTGSCEKIVLEACVCVPTALVVGCKISFTPKNLKEVNRTARNAGVMITHLDLNEGCDNITDAGAVAAVQLCRNLQSLNLSMCKRITDKGLAAVKLLCPNLSMLNPVEVVNPVESVEVTIDTQGGLVFGPEAWKILDIEVLDAVPPAPRVDLSKKDKVLLYIPEKVRVHDEEEEYFSLDSLRGSDSPLIDYSEDSLRGSDNPWLDYSEDRVAKGFRSFITPGWILIDKGLMPESRGKDYKTLIWMVGQRDCSLPHALEVCVLHMMVLRFTGELLFRGLTYTYCTEYVNYRVDEMEPTGPVIIGDSEYKGLKVDLAYLPAERIGVVCVQRKFN